MRHLSLSIGVCALTIAAVASADSILELEKQIAAAQVAERAAVANLQASTAGWVQPVPGFRIAVRGDLVSRLLQAFAALPPDARTAEFHSQSSPFPFVQANIFSFDSYGTDSPSHHWCTVQLGLGNHSNALVISARPDNLGLNWKGNGRYDIGGSVASHGHVDIRYRIIQACGLLCDVGQICDNSGCGEYCDEECDEDEEPHCCAYKELYLECPCSQCSVANEGEISDLQFDINVPPLCSNAFCPTVQVRNPDALEQAIVAQLASAGGSLTVADLAARVGQSVPALVAPLTVLEQATIVTGSDPVELSVDAREGAAYFPQTFLITLTQPSSAPNGQGSIVPDILGWHGITIPFDVPYPSGLLAAVFVNTAPSATTTIEVPAGVLGRNAHKRDLTVAMAPTKTTVTQTSLQTEGVVTVDWKDVFALRSIMQAHIVDVGAGSAVLLSFPDSSTSSGSRRVLVGLGPDSDRAETAFSDARLLDYLGQVGVTPFRTLSELVVGSQRLPLAGLIEKVQVESCIVAGGPLETAQKEVLRRHAVPWRALTSPEHLTFAGGRSLDLIPACSTHTNGMQEACGLVVIANGDGHRVVLLNDVSTLQMANLLAASSEPLQSADALIVDQKTITSLSKEALAKLKPSLIVIATGDAALAPTPSPKVLGRLAAAAPQARVLTTSADDRAAKAGVRFDDDGDDVLLLITSGGVAAYQSVVGTDGNREWRAQ